MKLNVTGEMNKRLTTKQSTHDPRKVRETREKKLFSIKKRYTKLRRRTGESKVNHTIEQNSPIREGVYNTERMKSEETRDEALQDSKERHSDQFHAPVDKLPSRKSRSQQRKKMMKKTKSGQPLMKYRIEKILSQI
eukprot:jgi/Picsp_1/5975/NSC_03330-R1_---NA---